jgi:hypothetical protein
LNPVATAPGSVFVGPRQGSGGTTTLSGPPRHCGNSFCAKQDFRMVTP